MKLKLIAAASLVAFSAFANAQSSATLTYGVKDTDTTPSVQSHVLNMSVKTRAFTNVDVDAGINTETADVARTVTNRYEIGVTPGYNITDTFRGDVRLATGIKQKSGVQDFGYYSVEPGVTAKFGDISTRVAYRYRTAYDSNVNADTSQTMRYSVGYALTKKDAIRLGYDVQSGDGANKQTTIAYTRSF
jgi:uncharacterized membrane protein